MSAGILAHIAAIVLAFPLALSVVTNLWSSAWRTSSDSPLGARSHSLLIVAEAGTVVLLFVPASPGVQFGAAACLYAALSGGVLYLLHQRGAVPCGCWGGSGHTLSPRLALTNGVLALLAFSQIGSVRSVSWGGALAEVIGVFALAFLAGVAFPDLRHAYEGVAERAEKEKRWFKRFPDLERV